MLEVAIGHSEDIDSSDAIDEVLAQCREALCEQQPQAALLFASIDHEFETVLNRIDAEFPGLELIGCTTDGEMSSVLGFAEDSIALMLLCSDEVEFVAGVGNEISKDPSAIIGEAVAAARSAVTQEPKLCLMTPSGLTVSLTPILAGVQGVLGETFPIFGGTAADQWRFAGTRQFYKTQVLTDAVPFLLLAGPILFSSGLQTGWVPDGNRATVTRAEGNVVHEIDNADAAQFYRRYLGDGDIGHIGEYPLAVLEDDTDAPPFHLRAPMLCDEETGSVTLAGEVLEGASVQITRSSRESIIEATHSSVEQALEAYPGASPTVAICFTCAGRKQVLGTRTREEYELLHEHYPDLPFVGFYGYGEIGPLQKDGPTRFHNETFVSLLLGCD